MFSKATISLLTLLAISGSTSASNLARRHDELTTTSTEIVYVTITQTLHSDTDVPYTVRVTPDVTPTTETHTTTEVDDIDAPYPTDDESTHTTVEVPLNGTTSWVPSPSGGHSTTIRSNETTYSTQEPNQPAPTEDDSGAAGMAGSKSVFAFALGVVGAIALML